MKYKIKLSERGLISKKGLSPQILNLVGEVVTTKRKEELYYIVGSGSIGLLKFIELKKEKKK